MLLVTLTLVMGLKSKNGQFFNELRTSSFFFFIFYSHVNKHYGNNVTKLKYLHFILNKLFNNIIIYCIIHSK